MRRPDEVHQFDWQTQTCRRCQITISQYKEIGKRDNNFPICRPQFFIPLVQPIIIKQPNTCAHPDINWAGTCYNCGEEGLED